LSRESEPTSTRDLAELEQQVEVLAGELAALINAASGEGRETLRELALTIVREEVRTAEMDLAPSAATSLAEGQSASSQPFSTLALVIPLFMMACVTIFLFPPVGLVLFGLCGMLVVVGLGASVFGRFFVRS
jgi:hypothetical protein